MPDMPKDRDELDELRARTLWDRDEDKVDPTEPWKDCPDTWKDEYRETARAIREADEAAGCVVVPVEATVEMATAHNEARRGDLTAWAITYKKINAANAAGPYGREK